MAKFETDLAAPQGAGASVVAPVDTGFNLPRVFGDLADAFAKGAANRAKEQAEAVKNQIVGEYTKKNAALDDALLQGGIDATRAATQRRSLFSQFASQYPEYTEDFNKVAKSFKEVGAIGTALDEEQAAKEQRRKLLGDAASKSGINVGLNDDPKVQDAAIRAHLAAVKFDDELKRTADQFNLQRGMNQEEREQFKQRTELNTNEALTQLGNAHMDLFSERIQVGVGILKAGGDITDIRRAAQEHLLSIRQQANNLTRLNPGMYQAFIGMFEEQMKILEDAPKIMNDDYENRVKQVIAKTQLSMLNSNPEYKRLVAASRGAPSVPMDSKVIKIMDQVINMSNDPIKPQTAIMSSVPNQQGAFEAYKQWRVQADKNRDPKANTEANNIGKGILKSYGAVGSVEGMSSDQVEGFVDFVASPEFLRLRSEGSIDERTIADAKAAHTQYYFKPISQTIENRILNETFQPRARTVSAPGQIPVRTAEPKAITFADMVEFKMVGDTLVAEPKIIKGAALDVADSQRLADEMRGSVKYINRLIASGANLDGYSSKAQYWEEQKHNFFPKIYPNPEKVKAGGVYEMDGKKYKYTGGIPWQRDEFWQEVTSAE